MTSTSTDDPLFRSLTAAQREAVRHVDGPLLILAGPGSGKTRVVTHRIAHLLRQGIAARSILALTFTNKAAAEMQRRLERLAPGQPVWMGTFHRFCARLLREHAPLVGLAENYTIYDTADSLSVVKRVIESLEIPLAMTTPQQVAHAISWAKNGLVTAENYLPRPGDPLGAIVGHVYPRYQRQLLDSNAVDFDDLLLHVATLLREHAELRADLDARYRYILVDEYQDTNLAQYAIVRALAQDYPNLAVTGDPDQSIYGWRGANLRNILDFEHDYPDVAVVRLEQNYRSTQRILRVAQSLIVHNRRRKEKALYTENAEGEPVRFVNYPTQRDEAETIAREIADAVAKGRRRPRDFAVFYRINALSRALEFAFRDVGVPYQIVNGVEFFQRREIKDVLGYLGLVNNPRDDVAFLRVLNTPPRGIGKSTLEKLIEHATRYRVSLLDAAREAPAIPGLVKRAAAALAAFVALVDGWSRLASRSVEEILGHVLSESGYQQHLTDSDSEEDQERLANIEELLTVAREFDEQHPDDGGLEAFLEQVCLVNDTDAWEADDDRVTLMTLHASKGLEFPVIYLTALEDGLIPHERSRERPEQLEEERRLLFVGITRAQEELRLSRAQYREFRGQRRMTIPSQFLMELPFDEIESFDIGGSSFVAEPAGRSYTWEDDDWRQDEPADDAGPPLAPQPAEGPAAPASAAAGKGSRFGNVRLATAAEMAGAAAAAPPVNPEVFAQGMAVRHPEYGLGKIVALAGSGPRRTATVVFPSVGQKKFMLQQSPLRPVR